MTTLRILGLHGVGDHHTDQAWKEEWKDTIKAAVHRWNPSIDVACDFPIYDDLFDDPKYALNPASYAEAVVRLSASGISVGIDALEDKIGNAVSSIGEKISGWFHPSSRDFSDLPNELRWTAGMVVQWADYDALRKASRDWLRQQLMHSTANYDLVLAHSLGSLIAYDTFIHDQSLLTASMTLALFGSQVGNPFVRDGFGGYLMPLKAPRDWYQLFNPNDRAFSAQISLPADQKFRRTETRFSDGFLSHNPLKYLSHPNAVASMWNDVVSAKTSSRAFGPINRALNVFDRTLLPETRDRATVGVGRRGAPNRRALLIGINDYPDPANHLDGCINDVFLISAALQESGFDPEDIRVVFDDRATTQGILERLHWLLDGSQDGDERVLFYSGHGAQIPGYGSSFEIDHVKECLVPFDFDWSEEHAITDTQLTELYSQLPYKTLFAAIFDCCHSGGLSRDGGAKVRGITPPDDIRHRMLKWEPKEEMWIPRDFGAITDDREVLKNKKRKRAYVGTSGANYRLGRGMSVRSLDPAEKHARRTAIGSRGPFMPLILEACGEQELAYEYRHGVTSYGAFTFSLAKELEIARHRTESHQITFDRLMRLTTARLHRLKYEQTPEIVGPSAVTSLPIPWRS